MKDFEKKRNFVILEIINSISSLKNEEISFVLLIKLWTVCAMSMKSIIKLDFCKTHCTLYEIVSCYDNLKDGF